MCKMISKSEKLSRITEIALEKGKIYGETVNSFAKYAIDHNDWNDVDYLIKDDPLCFFYVMKLCLKYGYLSKFQKYFNIIDFKNTSGYIEYLIICCIRYGRFKQLKLIYEKYKRQIDFSYNEFAIFKATANSKSVDIYKYMRDILKNNAKKEINSACEHVINYITNNKRISIENLLVIIEFNSYNEIFKNYVKFIISLKYAIKADFLYGGV